MFSGQESLLAWVPKADAIRRLGEQEDETLGARRGVLRCGTAVAFLMVLAGSAWAQIPEVRAVAEAALPDAPAAQLTGSQEPLQQEPPHAQPEPLGSIRGVVVDRDGTVYEGAQVALAVSGGSGTEPVRTATSGSDGRFRFDGVAAGAFKLTVSASGFAAQVVAGKLAAGESYEGKPIVLAMNGTASEVDVTASQNEIAVEQLKQEETQRVLGVMPNFYVTYVPNAPPLTAKQKFQLAWRSSVDPMNFVVVGAIAGFEQASDSFPGYGQGTLGYAKRYGAGYADGGIDNLIGGAILASWWKQDPRYFYKGTGGTRARALYAIANAVMCRGDSGKWQVDYSALVGGLAAGGISNLYYPAGSRAGAGLTFENALVGTGLSAVQNLFQEFLVRRLTPKVPKYGAGNP